MSQVLQEKSDIDFLLSDGEPGNFAETPQPQTAPNSQNLQSQNLQPQNPQLSQSERDSLPTYAEVLDSPYIFDSLLQKYFPEIHERLIAADSALREIKTNIVILKNGGKDDASRVQIQKFEGILKKVETVAGETSKEAEKAILSLYSRNNIPEKRVSEEIDLDDLPVYLVKDNSRNGAQIADNGNNADDLDIVPANDPRIRFATPAFQKLALCLAGINATPAQSRNPIWLARNCGLEIVEVREAIADQNFRAYINAIAMTCAKEIVRHGLNQKIRRLQEANLNLDLLHQLRYERGVLSTTQEEVSDEELLALGLDPKKRDIQAAMIPGASTGLLKKTPVVLRSMSAGAGGGNRTQIVQTYEIDTAYLRETRALMEFIAKELGEYGTAQVELTSQEVKTYKGFDPTQV